MKVVIDLRLILVKLKALDSHSFQSVSIAPFPFTQPTWLLRNICTSTDPAVE